MKTLIWVIVALMGIFGILISETAGAQSAVQRGEYLVKIMECDACHTPMGPDGRPDFSHRLGGHRAGSPVANYSGGPIGSFALTNTSWAGPWGVSFSRNLTPDPETGLGKWSEADFIKAIRTGTTPRRGLLLPPMPWPAYANATDADLKAIWAYLKTVQPIKNKVLDRIPPQGK